MRSFEINGESVLVAYNWHVSDVINSRSVFDGTIVDKQSLSAVETGQEIKVYTEEQLSNARDIGDGTFSRTSNATMQNGTNVTANVTRYETGQFGQAVMVEEGTTNQLPLSEDWTSYTGKTAGTAITDDDAAYAPYSALSDKIVMDAASNYVYKSKTGLSAITGQTWTFSAKVYVPAPSSVFISINDSLTWAEGWIEKVTLVAGWNSVKVTRTFGATVSTAIFCTLSNYDVSVGAAAGGSGKGAASSGAITFWVLHSQLEQKAYSTSWIDSGITRVAESLTIPTALVSSSEGTISLWVNPQTWDGADGTNHVIAVLYNSGGDRFDLIGASGTSFRFEYYNGVSVVKAYPASGSYFTKGAWTHVVATWTVDSLKLYANGVLVGSYNGNVNALSTNYSVQIGYSLADLPNYLGNALFDDLRISNIARDGAEILASYNSGAALPIDARTTAKMAFDGTLEIFARPVIFAGTIDAPEVIETDPGYLYYPITAVDYNQIADKRLYAASHESTLAGNIVSAIISAKLSEEGVTAGSIEDGPVISKANFNYKKCSESLDYIKDVSGMNWNIDFNKQLNFFSNSTNLAPWILSDTVQHTNFRVKRNRSQYRNRQYVRAGAGKTSEQALEKPSPTPDGSSRSFILRFPVAEKPVIFVSYETGTGIDSYAKTVLHLNGADNSTTFTDNGTTPKNWQASGVAHIDTAESVFGGASLYVGGEMSYYIYTSDHDDFYFGSANFTIDCWAKKLVLNQAQLFRQVGTGGTDYFTFGFDSYDICDLEFHQNSTTYHANTGVVITDNDWHHYAVVRSDNTLTVYIDGINKVTIDVTGITFINLSGIAQIGTLLEGYIDEFRISKGIARWTANFTLPTSEYEVYEAGVSAVLSANVGVNGLDSGKLWYFSYDSNIISQDSSQAVLTAGMTLEVTYIGLYPILTLIDNPAQIAERVAIETSTSGIYENFQTEKSINENGQATEYTEGLLLRYGIIPSIITFDTEIPGLKAGQLLPIQKTLFGINASYLIESVDISTADAEKINYSVRCLDGSALGGWERFFKDLLKGNQQYIIQENEVIILLSITTEKENWGSSTTITINGVQAEVLYD